MATSCFIIGIEFSVALAPDEMRARIETIFRTIARDKQILKRYEAGMEYIKLSDRKTKAGKGSTR